MVAAKATLAPLFAEPRAAEEEATFLFWGRMERGASLRPRRPARRRFDPRAGRRGPVTGSCRDSGHSKGARARARRDDQDGGRDRRDEHEPEDAARDARRSDRADAASQGREQEPPVVHPPESANHPRRGRSLAANRQALPDVLNTIAANKDWGNNPNIVTALIRNPKTPGTTSSKLMDKVPIAEVRRLAKANDVPRAVMAAARKRLADGGGSRYAAQGRRPAISIEDELQHSGKPRSPVRPMKHASS